MQACRSALQQALDEGKAGHYFPHIGFAPQLSNNDLNLNDDHNIS
jgi:hypothetical protein